MKVDKEELEKTLFLKTFDDELTLDDIAEQIRERLEYIDISKKIRKDVEKLLNKLKIETNDKEKEELLNKIIQCMDK